MNKGILFDYNGVIVNDEPLQEKATIEAAKAFDMSMDSQDYSTLCLGRTDSEGFANVIRHFNRQEIAIEDLIRTRLDTYKALIQNKSVAYEGIHDVIKNLANRFTMAIVTSSLREEVVPVLESEHLIQYFQRVITADEIQNGKPNPEGYELGVQELRMPKRDIVVIEDTPTGVQAAHNANLACIAVTHTVPAAQLQRADSVIDSVIDVTPELVDRVRARE